MPVFNLLERMMMKRLNFPPGILLRVVSRSAYVGKILILICFYVCEFDLQHEKL